MAYEQHQRSASDIVARCAIITVSDTRTEQTDASGQRIRELLEQDRHQLQTYRIVPDDPSVLGAVLDEHIADSKVDVILTNGGTGISRRDLTIPTIEQRLQTQLPGFGELFRMLGFQQIGSGAMLSRAVGGIAGGKLLFAVPGSMKAVELAMTKLILPELRHLLFEIRK
jgi:molybdenum cofactor biosynthesis protein B